MTPTSRMRSRRVAVVAAGTCADKRWAINSVIDRLFSSKSGKSLGRGRGDYRQLGQDMTLLLKAAADAGLQVNWYTMYAGSHGGPTAIKQANIADRVYTIVEGVPNAEPPEAQQTEQEFRARLGNGLGFEYPRVYNEMLMLKRAIEEAKSEDVKAVAQKLEGMTIKTFMGADGYMRKDDHQFFQDMYVASFGPLPQGAKFDQENTGWGWRAQAIVKAKDTEVPTTCKMKHPS
jgi:branched-chain amino acid transport system substrate-binding protein